MATTHSEYQEHDDASLLAEAHDLVSDRALRCELCRRRMRYFPVRGQVTVRAFGRRHSWRCLDCIAGGRMMAALLSGDGMLPADWLRLSADMAADLSTQFDELRRAHAGHPRPVLATALDCLGMQPQIVGEAMADHADAAALGNVIRLSEHRARRTSRPRGSAPGRTEDATL